MAQELALYRKYRPRTFAEVIGQEHVTEPLSQALRSGRLHHAYLFSGPRGCGKTSSARILARSLNCERGPTPEPCGECESCRALTSDGPGSIDVIEIDAASHGGVDDARDLRERAFFTPVSGRYKIYVIDEAHMVSSAGFNALLKLVEEPPDYVKFVFATTEPEKVLPTIKSRTHHYPFRLVPPGVLRPYLEKLCQAEGVPVEPTVFPLVVRAGGGSVRDSLSVLDQLISGAGPEGVGYPRAVSLLGVTDAALLDEVCDALAAGDGAAAFAAVDRVMEAGHDPRRFAADLLERLRDLIVLQQVPDPVAKGLLDAPDDQLSRMSTHASQLGAATLSRYAEIIHNGLVDMRGTTSPRLLLELICARMLLPGADDSVASLLHRLERLERRLGAADPVTPGSAPPGSSAPAPVVPPAPQPSAPPAPQPTPPAPQPSAPPPPQPSTPPAAPPPPHQVLPSEVAPAEAPSPGAPSPGAPAPKAPAPGDGPPPAMDAAGMRRVWDEVVATVGRKSKRAAAVVREATVRDVEGTTIVLQFQHTVHASMLTSAPKPLLDAVHQVLGGTWQLRCEARDTGAGGERPDRAPGRGSGSAPAGPGEGAAVATPATWSPGDAASSGPPSTSDPAGSGSDWPELARPGGRAGLDTAAPPSAPPPAPRPAAAGVNPGGPAVSGPAPARGQPPPGRDGARDPHGEADEVDMDGDERTDVGTSEQRALELLQRTLGAEKIGEVAP